MKKTNFCDKRSWSHNVGKLWLAARREHLTASEVKNLITDYKRIKAGKIKLHDALQFAKVYGSKMNCEIDTSSFGSMARGHIMEPYAIDEYNTINGTDFYPWDDKLIARGCLAFSPDAMDIPQLPGTKMVVNLDDELVDKNGDANPGPSEILEIKSYEAGQAFQRLSMIGRDEPLEERWQIATAMAVCYTIKTGTIMFYLPQCGIEFSKQYDRADLIDEIDTVMEIARMWNEYVEYMDCLMVSKTKDTTISEDQIYSDYLKVNNALSI